MAKVSKTVKLSLRKKQLLSWIMLRTSEIKLRRVLKLVLLAQILTFTRLQSTTVSTIKGEVDVEVEKKKHVKHKIPIKRFVFKPLNVMSY